MMNSFVSKELVGKPSAIQNSYLRSVSIIGSMFFIFAFVAWLNSVLIPYLKIACELTNFEANLIGTIFYISYLVMPLPSTRILRFIGFKKSMSVGLLVIALGCILLIPAATYRSYSFFITGLFIQGLGLAVLQTASNPYMTILGPLQNAATRLCIMGICHKAAVVIAPVILSSIVLSDADLLINHLNSIDLVQRAAALDGLGARVITPYIIMAVTLTVLALLLLLSGLPEFETNNQDTSESTKLNNKTSIFQFPHLLLAVVALFLYMGAEQIASHSVIYHNIPAQIINYFPRFTLSLMIIGYIIGIIVIPKFVSQEKALKMSAAFGILFTLTAVLADGILSLLGVALLGLANALIWPATWPLAIAGLGRFTKTGSAMLVMSISGGSLLHWLYKPLATMFNQQQAYLLLIPCYLFIWYYGAIGHRIGKQKQ